MGTPSHHWCPIPHATLLASEEKIYPIADKSCKKGRTKRSRHEREKAAGALTITNVKETDHESSDCGRAPKQFLAVPDRDLIRSGRRSRAVGTIPNDQREYGRGHLRAWGSARDHSLSRRSLRRWKADRGSVGPGRQNSGTRGNASGHRRRIGALAGRYQAGQAPGR